MLRQSAATPAAVPFSIRWRDPARDLSVEFHLRTIRRLQDLVSGTEVPAIGVLLGSVTRTPVEILILDVCVVASGDNASRLPLPEAIAQAVSVYASGLERRMYPVGLFIAGAKPVRSPSAGDLVNLAHIFKAVVPLFSIETQQSGSAIVRLYLWSPAGGTIEKGELEFPLDWRLLTQRGHHPFTGVYQSGHAATSHVPAGPDIPQPVPQDPALLKAPSHPDNRPPGRPAAADTSVVRVPKWFVTAFATAAFTAGAMWFAMRPQPLSTNYVQAAPAREAPSTSSDLGLEVSRSGTDLQVRWNRNSTEVLSAEFGFLRVLEDGNRVEVALDAEQLRTGRILYTPRAATVDLILDITSRHGRIQETVRVIQGPGMAPPTGWTPGVEPWRRNRAKAEPAADSDSEEPPAPVRKIFSLPPLPAAPKAAPSVDLAPPAIQHANQPSPSVLAMNQQAVTLTPPAVRIPSLPRSNPNDSVVTPPVLKSNISLDVPTHTRMLMRTPVLEVKVSVDERGRVTHVEPVPQAGIDSYVAHALAQRARYWIFEPAKRDGKPVAADHVLRLILKK